MEHKLNVSSGAGGITGVKRARFDSHLNDCAACAQPGTGFCLTAEVLWRSVLQAALRAKNGVTA